MTPHSGQRGRNPSIARLRATLPIGKPTPSEHTAATVPPKVTERMQIEHKPEATKHAPEPKQSLFPAPSPSRCFHTQVRAADGPQPVRTSKERGTKRALPGGRQLIALNRIHVLKARLLSLIGTESSRSRFGARRSAPRALEARRTRGAARGRGRSPGPAELCPTYGRGTHRAVQKAPQLRAANAPRGRAHGEGTERTAPRSQLRPPPSARGPSRAGRSAAAARRPSAARRGRGLLPAPRWQPPAPAGLAALLLSPLLRALPASLAPPQPPRCCTAYPASGADGLPGYCRCCRPAGRCGTALRCAAPRREGTIGAGSARLRCARGGARPRVGVASAPHSGGRGLRAAQRACVSPASGAARVRIAGGRRAAVPLRCAAGAGAVGGLGGEVGRGGARRGGGQPVSGWGRGGTAVLSPSVLDGRRSLGLPCRPGCSLVRMPPAPTLVGLGGGKHGGCSGVCARPLCPPQRFRGRAASIRPAWV